MRTENPKKLSRGGPRTVYLPAFIVDSIAEGERSAQVVSLATTAANAGQALSLVPANDLQAVKVRVPEALSRHIDALRGHGVLAQESDGSLLARLAYTTWVKSGKGCPKARDESGAQKPCATSTLSLPSLSPGRDFYPAQRDFIGRLVRSCDAGRIIGLESATGTGKGLVLATGAYLLARQGETVVIASPTHRISIQTGLELARLMEHNPEVGVAAVRGRQEFVSDQRLREYLDYDDQLSDTDRQALTDWVNRQDAGDEQCWLIETLPDTETALDMAALQLQASEADTETDAAYRRQFTRANQAAIVLCTHSMLCHDFVRRLGATSEYKRRIDPSLSGIKREEALLADARARFSDPANDQGVLPRYTTLLVDEGHQLELQFANAMTEAVSITSLVNHLQLARDQGVKGLVSGIEEAKKVLSYLRSVGAQGDLERIDIKRAKEMRALAARLADVASKAATAAGKKAKRRPDLLPVAARLSRSAGALRRALNPDNQGLSWFTFSPVRYYPRLETGPASVSPLLARMWSRLGILHGGAVLSATLYLPRHNGVPTAEPMLLYRLAILRSLLEPEPFPGGHRHVPKWVFEPVTLHRFAVPVGKSAHHPLCPPKNSQEKSEMTPWAQALAPELMRRTLSAARGGTLVLNTSYLAIDVLSEALLVVDPLLKQRLIVSDQRTPFELQRRRYLQLAAAGQRPVWLATGRAWTGLDLSMPHRRPEEDVALSDLVITRLPFNTNRTLSHQVRTSRSGGWKLNEQEMLFALRQGAGRLIRRQGLEDRHLWLYDPRAFDAARNYYAGVAALFTEYRHRQTMR